MNKEIDYKALNIDPDILAKAWDGDAASQLLLGKAYFKAVYTEENCSNAFKWIHLSAEQDNMEAQFRLADLFSLGQGASKSYSYAYEWYTKAALQGYRKASIRIFNLYQQDKKMRSRGQLNSKENKWTGYYFQKENNIRELNEYRLKYHESNLNHAIDFYTELFHMLKSENQEDPSVLLKLGFLYQYGFGVKKCIKLAIDFYKEAAEQGNRDARYHLGNLYENNTEIKFNYYLALRWYRDSATNGNIASQNALGYFYEKGLATELNLEGAFYWYTKAANAGNSDAQLTLGKLYRKGKGIDVDISQAIKWYTLAANQGNGAAQNCLNQLCQNRESSQLSGISSKMYYIGEHHTKPTLRSKLQDDIDKMDSLPHINQLKKLVEHAIRTDGNAMYKVGMKYCNGEDFTKNKEVGFQWIKKAAKSGLQEAELKIAEMYYDGDVMVCQDYHESSIWTTKLVKKKNDEAQCNLGLLYLYGEGVRKDPLEASKWFTKSADQGNAEAQYQVGYLRLNGLGIRKDKEEAVEWFNKSALNGNANAMYQLGELYERGQFNEHGEQTEGSFYKAIKLYEYSAKVGNHDSQVRLSRLYSVGEFVDQDLQKAEKYYQLSKNYLNLEAKYFLALQYYNGDFGNSDYIKAFEILKKIADEKPSSSCNPFQTPLPYRFRDWEYTVLLDMFTLALERGEHEICYNIGYLHENIISRYTVYDKSNKCYTDAIHWYSEAAFNGDARAQYRLGIIYEEGLGVKRDLFVAYNYYSEACDNGDKDAAYKLALMYLNGEGVAQDMIKAYCLFTAAFNKGHEKAYKKLLPTKSSLEMLESVANAGYIAVQYQLGVFYQDKDRSNGKAIKWLTLASKGGVTDAFYRLGTIYEELQGKGQNYSKAVHLYSEVVKTDHEEAIYRLARMYHLGKGVKRDYQKAYVLYSRAAELEHSQSSRILDITNFSITHSYTEDNESTAIKYSEDFENNLMMIKFVAKLGNSDLQYKLGNFYMTNRKHLNYNEAFKWYQMAASKENVNAIYRLGLLYENGQGTIQDYIMAYRFYRQAKEKGHRDAIYRLGIAYQYGLGVGINTNEAVGCYIRAAELGSNESQYELGKLYESGELVERDVLKALEWYTKAYISGKCDAINVLYQFYDKEPLKIFYKREFRILSNIENTKEPDDYRDLYSLDKYYGSLYFKLGIMYLNGQGTTKNPVKGLKRLLKAYFDYGYQDAEPFIAHKYDPYGPISQNTYLIKLTAYHKILDEIPPELRYELGMLYYNGFQYLSPNHIISSNPVVTTVLAPDYSMALRYLKSGFLKKYSEVNEQIMRIYFKGDGVEKNHQQAKEWLEQYAIQLNSDDCQKKGMEFYKNVEIDNNYEIALLYLQNAAKKNNCSAQARIGIMYLQGLGVERSCDTTQKWIQTSIETMDKSDCYSYGMTFLDGIEVEKNYAIALKFLQKAADLGDGLAQAQLGLMYLDGHGISKNESEGMEWIEKSINNMKHHECYEVGIHLYSQYKSEKFSIAASIFIKKAAEERNNMAKALLSSLYLSGNGVQKNKDNPIYLFSNSALNFTQVDCYNQGMKYCRGVEVEKNHRIAIIYLQKAALRSGTPAQFQILLLYLENHLIDINEETTMKFFQQSILSMDYLECYYQGMKLYNEHRYDISILCISRAAEGNYELAQAQLGIMLLEGKATQKNRTEAMEWIDNSMKSMSHKDCYNQGMVLYRGTVFTKDYDTSLLFIRKAAENHHGLAQAHLGLVYIVGLGVKRNKTEAMKWIKQSLKVLCGDECYEQGMKFYNGTEVDPNHEIALLYIQKAAGDWHGQSQAQLALMYSEGSGVKRNHDTAITLVKESLKEMRLNECYRQGMKFYHRTDLENNYDLAIQYLKRASKANAYAQAQLAYMYNNGVGVNQNYQEATRWYKIVENNYIGNSRYCRSKIHHYDQSGMQDFPKAFKLYQEELENIFFNYKLPHNTDAMRGIGLLYEYGDGITQDFEKAMEYYKRSISEKDGAPYYNIGLLWYYGKGVDQDYKEAFFWFTKAANSIPDLTKLSVFIEENSVGAKILDKSSNRTYSLQPESRITGEAHYYIGLMYNSGNGVDQDEDKAQNYFKMAHIHGVDRAKNLLK